jgi:hypothetical protein
MQNASALTVLLETFTALFALTNIIYEYFINKNKQHFIYKLVINILILIDDILIKK